jgi:hypothetical protein
MKRIAFLIIAACVFISTAAFGQPKPDGDWKEKIQAEKIAFLTAELNLTPQEAQTFWPIYNQINKEKDEATRSVIMAYKAMREAIDTGKSQKEISSLLDRYLAATAKQRELENGIGDRYKAALPVEKVARLYVGEEKFRRHHIRNMHHANR